MTVNDVCRRCIWNCNRYSPGDVIFCVFPRCVREVKRIETEDKIDKTEWVIYDEVKSKNCPDDSEQTE